MKIIKLGKVMYIPRDVSSRIIEGAKQIPVVALIGPRQSGKSTLCQKLFPNHTYLDMQDADVLEYAQNDPKGFLETYRNEHGIILDEVHYAPNIFAQIKVDVDRHHQRGYYVLAGSQNFLLLERISESLAGRVYFYRLLPFSVHELKKGDLLLDSADQIIQGFYPRVSQPNIHVREYYQNYIATYAERDIRVIRKIEDLMMFHKFIKLCALRIGSPLNISSLASDCGISTISAKAWLSLLATSFIIYLLPAYHNNISKRLIKSPKLYFYDVGLASALLNVDTELLRTQRTLYGGLFENMVVIDILKTVLNKTLQFSLTFLRDTNKNEIDLIVDWDGRRIPVEIKAGTTVNTSLFKSMSHFDQQLKISEKPVIVYGGKYDQQRSLGRIIPWTSVDKLF